MSPNNSELAQALCETLNLMLDANRQLRKAQEDKYRYETLQCTVGGLLDPVWIAHFSKGHPDIDPKKHFVYDVWEEFSTFPEKTREQLMGFGSWIRAGRENDPHIAEKLRAGIARAEKNLREILEALPQTSGEAAKLRARYEAACKEAARIADFEANRYGPMPGGGGGAYIGPGGRWHYSSLSTCYRRDGNNQSGS